MRAKSSWPIWRTDRRAAVGIRRIEWIRAMVFAALFPAFCGVSLFIGCVGLEIPFVCRTITELSLGGRMRGMLRLLDGIILSVSYSWIGVVCGTLIFHYMLRAGWGGWAVVAALGACLGFAGLFLFEATVREIPERFFSEILRLFIAHGIASASVVWILLRIQNSEALAVRHPGTPFR